MVAILAAVALSPVWIAPANTALACPSPRILVMSKTASFRHDAIPVAIESLKARAASRNLRIDFTEDSKDFNDVKLGQYDGVLCLLTTGDIFDDAQQSALQRFTRSGGGFIGLHAASDTEHDWPWYRQMLGAHFKSHPAGTHHFKLRVEDRANPSTIDLPEGWMRTDEWYEFKEAVVPHAEMLMTVETPTAQTPSIKPGHPIMWRHTFEGGRVWYSSMGHTKESYGEDAFMNSLLEGMVWACQGRRPTGASSLDRTKMKEGDGWIEGADARWDASTNKLASDPGSGMWWNQNMAAGGAPFLTKQEFGDCLVHLEFMIPKDGNSGVYLQGRYEVQIRDSFGIAEKDLQHSDCGGIYQRWKDDKGFEGTKPRRQAARPPGKWQTLDILYRAPRFRSNGMKTENARFVEVRLNGVVVQTNVEMTGPTRASMFENEKPTGPMMIQGDHGPTAIRNLWVLPQKL